MIPMSLASAREQTLVEEHLKSLQGHDRYLRFGAMLSDEAIVKYVEQSWGGPNEWLGIIEDRRVIAVVHVAREGDNKAELGLSVDPEWRGQHLGQALFERAVVYLKAHQVRDVYMHCLSENAIMKHIARKNLMQMVTEHGEVDADLILPKGNSIDRYQEVFMHTMSLYDNNARQMSSMWRQILGVDHAQAETNDR